MAGGLAAQQLDAVAGAVEGLGQEAHQGFVGRSIHRRGGDFYLEFAAVLAADLVGRGPRLDFDGQERSVGMRAQINRN